MSYEQSEPDFREIERRGELPPDEPYGAEWDDDPTGDEEESDARDVT